MKNNSQKWFRFSDYEWVKINGIDCIRPNKDSKFVTYNPLEENTVLNQGPSKSSLFTQLARLDVHQLIFSRSMKLMVPEIDENNKITPVSDEKKQSYRDNLNSALINFKSEIKMFVKNYGLLGYLHQYSNFFVGKPIFLPKLMPKSSAKITKQSTKNKDYFHYDPMVDEEYQSINNFEVYMRQLNRVTMEYFYEKKIPKDFYIKGIWPYQLVCKFYRGHWVYYWSRCNLKYELGRGLLGPPNFKDRKYFKKNYKSFDILEDDDYQSLRFNITPGIYDENAESLNLAQWLLYPEIENDFINQNKGITNSGLINGETEDFLFGLQIKKLDENREKLFQQENQLNLEFNSLYDENFLRSYSEPISIYAAFISSLRASLEIEDDKKSKKKIEKGLGVPLIDFFDNNSLFYSLRDSVEQKSYNGLLNSMTYRSRMFSDFNDTEPKNLSSQPSLIGYIGQMILVMQKTKMCPNCNSPHNRPNNTLYCSSDCQIQFKNKRNYKKKKDLNDLIKKGKKEEANKLFNEIFSNKKSNEAIKMKNKIKNLK